MSTDQLKRSTKEAIFVAIALAAPASHATISSTSAFEYRKVALIGEPIPGQTEHYAGSFSQQFILPDGRVGFVNSFRNSQDIVETNIWTETGAGLTHVIGPGIGLPQIGAGITIDRVEQYPNQGEDGRIGIEALIQGPGVNATNDKVLLLWDSGALQVVAREGDSAVGSGLDVSIVEGLVPPRIANTGITFESLVAGQAVTSSNNKVLWHQDNAGALSTIARSGDQAPGLPAGTVHGNLGFNAFMNADGAIALLNYITGPGLGSNSRAVWIGDSNQLQLLTQTGEQAPTLPAGVNFSTFGAPRLNREGNAVFYAQVSGPGYSGSLGNNQGYWFYHDGNIIPIAMPGDLAPDLDTGEVLENATVNGFSGGDHIVFSGGLKQNFSDRSATGWGIWAGTPGNVELVYRGGHGDGDQPPGVEPGLELRDADAWINRNGLVVILARLSGPGLTTENNRGIWVTDPGGELRLLLRHGDEFDVNPDPAIDDLRKIISIGFNHGALSSESGSDLGFNGNNELVLYLSFEDTSSGVYVFNIPEPTSLALFGLGLGTLGLRRRR